VVGRLRGHRVGSHRLASGHHSGLRACSMMLVDPMGMSCWLLVGQRGRAMPAGAAPASTGASGTGTV
jgi:hypothetical protein